MPSGPTGHFITSTSQVLMINGDRLMVRHRPAGEISSMDPAPDGGAVLTLQLAGTTYDVPADALPYLGRGLDLNLFNRGLLERLETSGQLNVTISYRGQRPSLPGIHVRRWGGTTATGVLTANSARAFGAALFRQYRSQHATGNHGGGGLFADGVDIALAGAPATGTVRPKFPMHTLTVTGTTATGKGDSGDSVIIINVDNPARFGDPVESLNDFFHGTSKFSVPSGHYWAIADFTTPVGNHHIAQRVVVDPQFTVSGNTRLHLAARSATSQIMFQTPRPAVLSSDSVQVTRTGAQGGPVSISAVAVGSPIWVSPARTKPTIGTIQSYTFGQLVSPPKTKGTPYAYSLDFAGPVGMIPPQHFTAAPASLATVNERYYLSKKAPGTWSTGGGFAAQIEGGVLFALNKFTMPGQQTQYLTGGPDIMWTSAVLPSSGPGELDALHAVTAGQQITDNWNAYPLHPQPRAQLLTGKNARKFPVVPSAWRSGDEMFLLVSPFGDNQLGHTGEAEFSAKSSVLENGKKLRLLGFPGFQSVKLNPAPGTVVYSLTTTLRGPQAALSARTTTTWSFRTSRSASTSAPPGWRCPNGRAANSKCSIPSMISLNYTVANLALNGVSPAGTQTVDLAVGHFQPSVRPAAITEVTAQVSYDGGKTWQPANTTPQGAGHYQLAFTPPSGSNVTTRITATDSTGASVTETILNAYRVGAPAAARPAPARSAGLKAACPKAPPGFAQCFGLYRPQTAVNKAIAAGEQSGPRGLTAKEIEAAYRLPVNRNSHQTVAVSIAFHTPHLAQYLATYRHQMGLPPCTVKSGCFRQVNEKGKALPLEPDGSFSGWDLEADLDVSMISVACPRCKIIVIEAKQPSLADLAATDNTAARLGANVISNSYGAREDGLAMTFAKSYDHPGHITVASSGDDGYTAAQFPANLTTVTAAGGTTLARARNQRGWWERTWLNQAAGAGGSGCSAYVPKPAWQHDNHCQGRTTADISAVADNIPVFDKTYGGWVTVAGTSVSAPLISGIYGLAGNAAKIKPGYAYSHRQFLFDVTQGSNALSESPKNGCGGDYLCVARKGYDAPTGLGTPNGIKAF